MQTKEFACGENIVEGDRERAHERESSGVASRRTGKRAASVAYACSS